MNNKPLLTLAAFLALTACGGASSTGGVTKAGEAKSGFMGLSKTDSITIDNADAFKAVDKVTIGSFTLGFATYKTASAKAGGGLMGGGFGGKSTAKSTLIGIDDALMQKITDEAYKNFLADLKSKGYTVVSRDALLTHKDFASTSSQSNPWEDSSGGFFGPKSTTKYFAPTGFKDIKVFAGDIPGTMGGFAFGNPTMGAITYAKETGVKVLHVIYVMDFANADSYGGSWTSSSSVTIGQGLTVVPGVSKIGLIGGEGGGTFGANPNGHVALGQPITSEKEFATVADSTSGASRGMEVAANVIGVLGGVGTNSSRDYEFKARPKDYKAAANDAFKQANTALVEKMAGLK